MILYHGSNVIVKKPRLLERQRRLDFGNGFYTTLDKNQAVQWAKRVARLKSNGVPTLNVYEFDETSSNILNVLKFDSANEEWLDYVVENRTKYNLSQDKQYDIVWGPIADDQTIQTISFYMEGSLSKNAAIEMLLPQKLSGQFVFKSEKALVNLNFMEAILL